MVNMRNILIQALGAIAVFLCVGCQKDTRVVDMGSSEEVSIVEATGSLTITVDAASAETKADLSPDPYYRSFEDNISTLSAYVFTSDGTFEKKGIIGGGNTTLTISGLTPGTKKVHVCANIPTAIADVATEWDLNSQMYNLSDISVSSYDAGFNIPMSGYASNISVTANSTTAVPITIKRHMARIVLASVTTRSVDGGMYASSAGLTLVGAFLTNIVAQNGYTLNTLSNVYAHKSGLNADLHDLDITEDTFVGGVMTARSLSLDSSGALASPSVFYCFRNIQTNDPHDIPSTASEMSSWASRRSRLVLQFSSDSGTVYYPVTLPYLNNNTNYVVNVEISGAGVPRPEMELTKSSYSVTVAVSSWGGVTYTENF